MRSRSLRHLPRVLFLHSQLPSSALLPPSPASLHPVPMVGFHKLLSPCMDADMTGLQWSRSLFPYHFITTAASWFHICFPAQMLSSNLIVTSLPSPIELSTSPLHSYAKDSDNALPHVLFLPPTTPIRFLPFSASPVPTNANTGRYQPDNSFTIDQLPMV
jgi:hypothetical protein